MSILEMDRGSVNCLAKPVLSRSRAATWLALAEAARTRREEQLRFAEKRCQLHGGPRNRLKNLLQKSIGGRTARAS